MIDLKADEPLSKDNIHTWMNKAYLRVSKTGGDVSIDVSDTLMCLYNLATPSLTGERIYFGSKLNKAQIDGMKFTGPRGIVHLHD